MRPVKDFCGYWNPDKRAIQFKWSLSGMENDRYIYIMGIREEGGTMKIDTAQYLFFDICDMSHPSQSSTFMTVNNLRVGVYKMRFCAFSLPKVADVPEDEILKACKEDESFIATVVMGRACITYVAETSIADNAKTVKIYLKSDSSISEGVLGYRYCIDNFEIINPFPGMIEKGKTFYPPFLIPRESDVQIVPIDKQFSGNLVITSKNNKFLF